jgi:hypothetical protein
MKPEVEKVVLDALKKGREMREAQKEYFRKRQQKMLEESKWKEAAFDLALKDAEYAVANGRPPMFQEELPL